MSIYGIKKSDATRQTINLIQLGDCMKLVVKNQPYTKEYETSLLYAV